MGEVYEAEDLELGGRIALKTVRTERVAGYEGLIHRFRREFTSLVRLPIVTSAACMTSFDIVAHQETSHSSALELLSVRRSRTG